MQIGKFGALRTLSLSRIYALLTNYRESDSRGRTRRDFNFQVPSAFLRGSATDYALVWNFEYDEMQRVTKMQGPGNEYGMYGYDVNSHGVGV